MNNGKDLPYKVIGKPDEEKKLIVTPKTIIATTAPGTKEDLKAGLKVFVAGAPKLPDGSLTSWRSRSKRKSPRRSDMMTTGETGWSTRPFRYFLNKPDGGGGLNQKPGSALRSLHSF